jgi:hypothetical protein
MMSNFRYLKILFSPFKLFKLKWYVGKIAIGTPYFLPRKWINHPTKKGYQTAIPRKIGFDFVSLGWKTKYDSIRYESAPLVSFVFFKWQIAVVVNAPISIGDHYWECWLAYEYYTDKTKSKAERIAQAREEHPQIWRTTNNGEEYVTNYWNDVLKKRWLIPSKKQNRGLTS